jgi:predicted XRE-type DNA-binding protein
MAAFREEASGPRARDFDIIVDLLYIGEVRVWKVSDLRCHGPSSGWEARNRTFEIFRRARKSCWVTEFSRSGSDTRKHGGWRVRMKRRNPIQFEESSGNIFVDSGLEDSGELYARAQIGVHVFRILKDKKLKQREIAGVLGIAQPDVSHLMNGHFSRFTTDKLLDFLKRLNQKVKIEVSRRHKGEPYQQVIVASQR